jgi:hypothetical protein
MGSVGVKPSRSIGGRKHHQLPRFYELRDHQVQQDLRYHRGRLQRRCHYPATQDIVAMMAAVKRKHVPTGGRPSNPKNNTDLPANPNKRKMPPFVKHFKSSTSSDAPNYKVGDSKNWDNTTWYFCDCPHHRDKIK